MTKKKKARAFNGLQENECETPGTIRVEIDVSRWKDTVFIEIAATGGVRADPISRPGSHMGPGDISGQVTTVLLTLASTALHLPFWRYDNRIEIS